MTAGTDVPGVDDVTTVLVNYRTLEHTRTCLDTLREAYPALQVLVIDNGSQDDSTDHLRERAAADPRLELVVNAKNVFHGPALHQGMQLARTPFAFLLDSDCVIESGGFLEPLLRRFAEDPLLYAIGKKGWTNAHGYGPVSEGQRRTAYVHPFAGVFDRQKYATLPPFVHHGAPLYRNMWGAARAGYHLEHAYVEDHVRHLGKVTASVHGYGYDRALDNQLRLHQAEARVRRAAARLLRRPLVPPTLLPGHSPSRPPRAG